MKKWFLSSSYNPHSNLIETHLNYLKKGFDHFSGKFDNGILIGEFNSEISNKYLKAFCESYNLKSLIKYPICFKNYDKPTCIDFILKNQPWNFQSSYTIDTRLSDFDRLTGTVLKTYFEKQEPDVIMYCDYKKFSNQIFREEFC